MKPVDTIHNLSVGQSVKTDEATITKTDAGYAVSLWPGRTFRSAWDAWTAGGRGLVSGWKTAPLPAGENAAREALAELKPGEALMYGDEDDGIRAEYHGDGVGYGLTSYADGVATPEDIGKGIDSTLADLADAGAFGGDDD